MKITFVLARFVLVVFSAHVLFPPSIEFDHMDVEAVGPGANQRRGFWKRQLVPPRITPATTSNILTPTTTRTWSTTKCWCKDKICSAQCNTAPPPAPTTTEFLPTETYNLWARGDAEAETTSTPGEHCYCRPGAKKCILICSLPLAPTEGTRKCSRSQSTTTTTTTTATKTAVNRVTTVTVTITGTVTVSTLTYTQTSTSTSSTLSSISSSTSSSPTSSPTSSTSLSPGAGTVTNTITNINTVTNTITVTVSTDPEPTYVLNPFPTKPDGFPQPIMTLLADEAREEAHLPNQPRHMAGGITVAPPIIIPTKHMYTPRIYLTRIAHLIDDEGKIRPTFVTLTPSDFMEYLSFKTMLTFPPDRVMTSTSLSSIPLSVTWWKPIKPGQIYNEVVDPRTAPLLTRPLTEIYSTLTVSWPTDIPLPSASLETTSSTTSTTSTSTTLHTSTSTTSIPFFKTWQKPIRSDDASNEAVDPRTATLSTRPLTEIYPTLTTSSSSSEETSAHRRTRTRDFTLFRAKFSPPSSKTSQASTAAEASAIPLHIKPSPARP